jgi:hypothetical protein
MRRELLNKLREQKEQEKCHKKVEQVMQRVEEAKLRREILMEARIESIREQNEH